MESEIWKDIEGYEGLYQISDLGRVRSIRKVVIGKALILKYGWTTGGYLTVSLCKHNIKKTIRVHRLVAEAFIPNPNNYKEINHINCNKKDNRKENLEWCSSSMNKKHAYQNGLLRNTFKPTSVILTNNNTGEEIYFDSMTKAAEYIGCCRQTIMEWLNGTTPYKNKYRKYSIKTA